MIDEARRFTGSERPFTIGATSGLQRLPSWKRDADRLFVQVGWSVPALLEWRASIDFDGPVYAGVMVIPSPSMARKLSAEVPQLAVPAGIVERIEHDRDAGVAIAVELIEQIRESNAFDGVHLIPVNRYREVAARLER